MKWVKAPEELKEFLEKAMTGIDCEKRPMFGYPAYFVNSHMFIGLFQDKLFVRLSPQQMTSLSAKFPSISNLEPMPGRPMKDYFVLPKGLYTNMRMFKDVVQTSAEYTRTLTPKIKKEKKAR